MSSLEDRMTALEHNPFAERTAWAMSRLEEQRRAEEGYGAGVMLVFAAGEEATEGNSPFAYAAAGAKWATIWFFMITPVVVMWNFVYG